MIQLFLVGIICTTQIWGEVHNIVIPRGKPYDFTSPGYPNQFGWTDKDNIIEWNFEADQDSTVKVVCDDIRMVQRGDRWTEDCPNVSLNAIDGNGEEKVCDNGIYNFVHESDGSKLKIKFVTSQNGGGLIKCTAYNTGDPEPTEMFQLHPNGRPKRVTVAAREENPQSNLDKFWVFESPEGTRMSFQCSISTLEIKPRCGKLVLTFNNGEKNEEICGAHDLVLFSAANKAKLRFQLDERGMGYMTCVAQAVTGPHPNEYENIVSKEVDSSEHGVTPGARKTSCKCGWANKKNARVLNGVETNVNEFPWMVYMDIMHETGGNRWYSFCGASIITSRHVLSAAHCVVDQTGVVKPQNLGMTLAKHDETKPTGKEVTIVAERIFVKDTFLKKGLAYDDIAVIFTKETIDFSTPIIGPVCIEPTEYQLTNRRIIIMGWGLTEKYVNSHYLRKTKARVMDPVICEGNAWDVCTGTSPSAACSGDSGGPLVWLDPETNRYSQISLVSRGSNVKCTGRATYSTLVAYYYDWIQEIIKNTDPSVNTCHKI